MFVFLSKYVIWCAGKFDTGTLPLATAVKVLLGLLSVNNKSLIFSVIGLPSTS